jgi:hypothetical protein
VIPATSGDTYPCDTIPDVVAYNASVNNPIAHEYTLLSQVEGATLGEIYQSLDDQQISRILDQLIDFLARLHAHEWDVIGGLNLNDKGESLDNRKFLGGRLDLCCNSY